MSRITIDLFDTYKEMATEKILNEETDSVNESYYKEQGVAEAKDNEKYHLKSVKPAPYLNFKSGQIVGHTVSSTENKKGANIIKHKETGDYYAAGGSSTAFTAKTTLHKTPEAAAKAYHKGNLAEGLETITVNFVVENTYQVEIPSSITYQDYLNAINTIIDSDDENIQAEIISIANEAFENNKLEIIAEAELIKQGILEAAYKRTKEGDTMRSPELKGMVNREKPGVVKFTRDLANTTGESKKEAGSRRREDKKQVSPNAVKRSTVRAAGMKPGPVTITKFK